MRRWIGLTVGVGVLAGLVVASPLLRAALPGEWKPTGPGQPVWSSVSEKVSGEAHCGWEGIPFLFVTLHDRVSAVYARDVDGLIGTSPPFRADVTLPSDAIFTGWRNGGRGSWADARMDRRGVPVSIYIVSSTGVERWPQGMGCVQKRRGLVL